MEAGDHSQILWPRRSRIAHHALLRNWGADDTKHVSQKMLITNLRCLERDGIVAAHHYPEVPPKVEYQLTEIVEAFRPIFHALLDWSA
jgi:DNA-binding HxlR family transcriptional regulator